MRRMQIQGIGAEKRVKMLASSQARGDEDEGKV